MAELTLVKDQVHTFPKQLFKHFSVFIQKGEAEILYRMENGETDGIKMVTGDKQSWNDLTPMANFEFTSHSDSCVIHYHIDR
jgi:hypothetical protein